MFDHRRRRKRDFAIDCRFCWKWLRGMLYALYETGVGSKMLNFMGSTNKNTTCWTAYHMAALAHANYPKIPLIEAKDAKRIFDGLMLWDLWPVEHFDGSTLVIDGWEVWVIMCASSILHPDDRHDVARLRLALYRGGEWRDCGYLLPEGLNPGTREWAGSSVYDPAAETLTLFFTAAGRRGEAGRSVEQRLFQTTGQLSYAGGSVSVTNWSEPVENVVADDVHYVVTRDTHGEPGLIKGFRDPSHFRDPANGRDYLLFTASLKGSVSNFNGVIGIAQATDEGFSAWQILPPLISADGLNNELERPVMRVVDGRYYVFWSTHTHTFAPDGPKGPEGLYGMVADTLFGPYRPINGSGLVAGNPSAEPLQSYSWWVTHDLEVAGFIEHWGLQGRSLQDVPDLVVKQFGGTPAPRFRLALDGDRVQIATS
jgi:levansucrase